MLPEKWKLIRGLFNTEGKIKVWPSKQRKKELVLAYFASKFEHNRQYTEKEVNAILEAHHTFSDPASLRRLLFGYKFLNRTLDGRAYWKREEEERERDSK